MYHLYHREPCGNCGRYYLPFTEGESCPWCGAAPSAVYDAVPEVVRYARLTLLAQGNLELDGFEPLTPADPYLIRGFELLDAYRHHPTLPPDEIATEAVHHFRRALPADESVREHWRRFFAALLGHWQAERNKPLEFD